MEIHWQHLEQRRNSHGVVHARAVGQTIVRGKIKMTQNQPRDAGNWAQTVDTLKVTDVPAGATNINVDGRHVQSPMQGFGQMVQKLFAPA